MRKCCVFGWIKDRMVDFAKSQSKMVTVKELSLDSFKHVPLETWALDPENTYKGANGKVYPWTCQTCTKKKLKSVSRLEKPKAEQAGILLPIHTSQCDWSPMLSQAEEKRLQELVSKVFGPVVAISEVSRLACRCGGSI